MKPWAAFGVALTLLGAPTLAQDAQSDAGQPPVKSVSESSPASETAPAETTPQEPALDQPSAPEPATPDPTLTLSEQFAPFLFLPMDREVADGAVDLAGFEPKRDIKPKPKPKPEPRARGTVRSLGTGIASYYGRRFHGRRTANGERFNMNAMTAAHKTLPFGTKVRVTNPRNGKSVVVRINDRGPYIRGRTIDLSRAAARRIGMISSGHARVRMEIVR